MVFGKSKGDPDHCRFFDGIRGEADRGPTGSGCRQGGADQDPRRDLSVGDQTIGHLLPQGQAGTGRGDPVL